MVKEVLILKTPGCASCAQATVLINKIKKDGTLKINVKEIDITKNPSILRKYPIMSSPGIVIDDKLEFVGVPSEKEFIRLEPLFIKNVL